MSRRSFNVARARVGAIDSADTGMKNTSSTVNSSMQSASDSKPPYATGACFVHPLFPPQPESIASKILLGAGVLYGGWVAIGGAYALGALTMGASLVGSKILDDALDPFTCGKV